MLSVIKNIYKTTKGLNHNGIEQNGIDCSLAAVPVDFFGLCRKLARTRSTSSSAVNGRPLYFSLHRHRAAEMRNTKKKTTFWGKNLLSCSFYLHHKLL
jgi:hypothetical protein